MNQETKVGILSIVAIVIFILGFSFLRGSKLFKAQHTYYAYYDKVDGLYASDAVFIRGYQVGKVERIQLEPKVGRVLVTLVIDEEIVIPTNSVALLYSADLLGDKSINLILGNAQDRYADGDTINTDVEKALREELGNVVTPMTDQMAVTMQNVDLLISNLNTLFGAPSNPQSLNYTVAALNESLGRLDRISKQMENSINNQNSQYNQIMGNVGNITQALDDNTENLTAIIENFKQLSTELNEAELAATVNSAQTAMNELNALLKAMNEGDGSIGNLVHNPELYNNLEAASKDLDRLLIDMRENPGRYIHFSVFGGADKAEKKAEKQAKKEAKAAEKADQQ